MSTEFNLIEKYFTRPAKQTILSVGDDAALIRVAEDFQLAISSDMLVAGTHFFSDTAPYDIGWKSLAVNVSDMAAMGANPKWATLAIALPKPDEAWVNEFSRGFFTCADAFNIDLIGGDTTRGPLNISVTIMGEVPAGKALRRDGAQAGDDIWVSGQLGNAALALAHLQGKLKLANDALQTNTRALNRPMPRAELGLALRDIAHSAIDISDGLLSDLGHILKASSVGAEIHLDTIPCSVFSKTNLSEDIFRQYVLAGGDDYELCFTAPLHAGAKIHKISSTLNLPITRIGSIHARTGLIVLDENKKAISIEKTGYDHFSEP